MNAITQFIVNQSTLELVYIKITNATKESFLMSMEAKVAKTGPVGVIMSPMTVDMCGPAGIFGRLNLPEIKTDPSGTTISVTDQKIQIVNMDNFLAFNKAITVDDDVILSLENGHTTLQKSLFSASIVYKKDVALKGMSGPKTIIEKTEPNGKEFKNTVVSFNTSPLEIDLGTVKHEIRNSKGEKIAEQRGKVYLARGKSTYVMTGVTSGMTTEKDARLVGVGVEEEDVWPNQAILSFNVPLTLTDEFLAMYNLNRSSKNEQ